MVCVFSVVQIYLRVAKICESCILQYLDWDAKRL